MRIKRIPSGYIELLDGVLTIEGNDGLVVRLENVLTAGCREGRRILVAHAPYGIFEMTYLHCGETTKFMLLFYPPDMPFMQAMCAQISEAKTPAEAA